ncbi:MAG: hypothetical protein ACI4DW_06130 [Lachnospiraceae bacterium]
MTSEELKQLDNEKYSRYNHDLPEILLHFEGEIMRVPQTGESHFFIGFDNQENLFKGTTLRERIMECFDRAQEARGEDRSGSIESRIARKIREEGSFEAYYLACCGSPENTFDNLMYTHMFERTDSIIILEEWIGETPCYLENEDTDI